MKNKDYIFLVDKYNKNLEKFGVSPSAVGWVSGKQKERYLKCNIQELAIDLLKLIFL